MILFLVLFLYTSLNSVFPCCASHIRLFWIFIFPCCSSLTSTLVPFLPRLLVCKTGYSMMINDFKHVRSYDRDMGVIPLTDTCVLKIWTGVIPLTDTYVLTFEQFGGIPNRWICSDWLFNAIDIFSLVSWLDQVTF
jgi:hypothetical protein